jgi:hypothetical protein
MMDISKRLVEVSNHHGGMLAELLEGAASEIDLLKDEKADLLSRAEKAEAERDRYKAALTQIVDDYDPDYQGERSLALTAELALKGNYAIRALPIKEAALSAKEGK